MTLKAIEESPAPAVRCPTEQALELVANKWTVHIIYLLDEHPFLRFRELQRALGTITQKELT
ncbi:MAG TPA: winged helix-turn-helix transcriptional regulator, partial [Polyangiaceae bacterium]